MQNRLETVFTNENFGFFGVGGGDLIGRPMSVIDVGGNMASFLRSHGVSFLGLSIESEYISS